MLLWHVALIFLPRSLSKFTSDNSTAAGSLAVTDQQATQLWLRLQIIRVTTQLDQAGKQKAACWRDDSRECAFVVETVSGLRVSSCIARRLLLVHS